MSAALWFREVDGADRQTFFAYNHRGDYAGNVQFIPGTMRGIAPGPDDCWLASYFDPSRDKGGSLGTGYAGWHATALDAQHALVNAVCLGDIR